MNHVETLMAMYDGPIPRGALQDAQALDDAERADPVLQAARAAERAAIAEALRAPPLPRGKRIERMADIMVARAADDGACTEADILAAGFTPDEIQSLGTHARLRARRIMADRVLGARA